jgi:hypothetical protein
MQSNILIQLERIANAATQQGQHAKAAAVWDRINALQRVDVQDLVKAISYIDDEVIWTLQHTTSNTDDQIRELCARRKAHLSYLSTHTEWLAQYFVNAYATEHACCQAAQMSPPEGWTQTNVASNPTIA